MNTRDNDLSIDLNKKLAYESPKIFCLEVNKIVLDGKSVVALESFNGILVPPS